MRDMWSIRKLVAKHLSGEAERAQTFTLEET